MDAAYKSDIREMNELNYARFEAKLDQRLAESRLDLADFRGEMRATLATLDSKLEKGLREQTRFFFGAWGVLLAAIIALSFRR